jgi:hypothetical protein
MKTFEEFLKENAVSSTSNIAIKEEPISKKKSVLKRKELETKSEDDSKIPE